MPASELLRFQTIRGRSCELKGMRLQEYWQLATIRRSDWDRDGGARCRCDATGLGCCTHAVGIAALLAVLPSSASASRKAFVGPFNRAG